MKIDLVDGTTVMSVIYTTLSHYANFMPTHLRLGGDNICHRRQMNVGIDRADQQQQHRRSTDHTRGIAVVSPRAYS